MNTLNVRLFFLIFLFNAGCTKNKPTFSFLPDSKVFEQDSSAVNNKVDILFVINDQPSMSSHQSELVASFQSFMTIFQDKGFDFKIAVVTTSAYMADPTLNGYDISNEAEADFNDYNGSVYSGVHVITPDTPDLLNTFAINAKPTKNSAGQDGRSFSSFRQALQSTRSTNLGFVRQDAFLAVVLVDNSDDFSGNERCTGCNVNQRYNASTLDEVSIYRDFLDQVKGSSSYYNVSAMTQTATPCQGGSNMTRIMDLANMTNGILGDICQDNFGASMAEIADKIATLSTQFYLDRLPDIETIEVLVDGIKISNNNIDGWIYNSTNNSIEFYGSSVPKTGSQITVNFDPISFIE